MQGERKSVYLEPRQEHRRVGNLLVGVLSVLFVVPLFISAIHCHGWHVAKQIVSVEPLISMDIDP